MTTEEQAAQHHYPTTNDPIEEHMREYKRAAFLSGVSWQKENGWISVEDELPAVGERVLTWLQGAKLTGEERNEMFVGYKMNEKNDVWIVGNAFSFDLGKVTHWQKLPPSPPKNDKV